MKNTVVTILIATGLCVVGSDGDYFPWVNFIGLFILCTGAVLAEYWFGRRK